LKHKVGAPGQANLTQEVKIMAKNNQNENSRQSQKDSQQNSRGGQQKSDSGTKNNQNKQSNTQKYEQ
jgi:hypothetical protein